MIKKNNQLPIKRIQKDIHIRKYIIMRWKEKSRFKKAKQERCKAGTFRNVNVSFQVIDIKAP